MTQKFPFAVVVATASFTAISDRFVQINLLARTMSPEGALRFLAVLQRRQAGRL